MRRVDILKKSLQKKKEKLNEKYNNYFSDVAQANCQPLNDKRGGQTVLNRWENKKQSIHSQMQEIEKTEIAIEEENWKKIEKETVYNMMPHYLKELIDNGELVQWGKHPKIMFVRGVDKARIVFDEKTKMCSHRYLKNISDKYQHAIFRDTYNNINKLQKDFLKTSQQK